MMVRPAVSLRGHLERLKHLRGPGGQPPAQLAELKAWQSERLRATYVDIAAQPRFRAATAFFLEDLYGPKDFSGRDQAMMRILPVMTRVLPASAVETAALAIELEALSEDLDHRVARALPAGTIEPQSYAQAYRAGSTRPERERQIDLTEAVGLRLDALVKKTLVHRTLNLMRTPAQVAGLADLQDFLERGFAAFRDMHGAAGFLALIRERETAILNAIFSGKAWPSA